MRNQGRKLFPQMAKALSEVDESVVMHWHTFYPDKAWNIPYLLNKYNIQKRVYFTYICPSCNTVKARLFSGIRRICKCGKVEFMASTQTPVSENDLCKIYNASDICVQYAVGEGLGIQCVEAAACGIKSISVSYSGMMEHIEGLESLPVPVLAFRKEYQSNKNFAVPDNDSLINYLNSNETWSYDRNHIRKLFEDKYSKKVCIMDRDWETKFLLL